MLRSRIAGLVSVLGEIEMSVGGKPEKPCWSLIFGLSCSEKRGIFGVNGGGKRLVYARSRFTKEKGQ